MADGRKDPKAKVDWERNLLQGIGDGGKHIPGEKKQANSCEMNNKVKEGSVKMELKR